MARIVLTRREGESIIIGDDIMVTIREARQGSASVVVDAPRDVTVDRSEVWKRKKSGVPAPRRRAVG